MAALGTFWSILVLATVDIPRVIYYIIFCKKGAQPSGAKTGAILHLVTMILWLLIIVVANIVSIIGMSNSFNKRGKESDEIREGKGEGEGRTKDENTKDADKKDEGIKSERLSMILMLVWAGFLTVTMIWTNIWMFLAWKEHQRDPPKDGQNIIAQGQPVNNHSQPSQVVAGQPILANNNPAADQQQPDPELQKAMV